MCATACLIRDETFAVRQTYSVRCTIKGMLYYKLTGFHLTFFYCEIKQATYTMYDKTRYLTICTAIIKAYIKLLVIRKTVNRAGIFSHATIVINPVISVIT